MTAHLSKGCLLLFYVRGYHRDINKSCTYRILSVSAIKKRDTRENLVSFFMPCDRRVPGAAAPTAAGGRRRKVMQARNREFRRLNAERESGRPDFEVGKAGSNPVSASEKGIQEKILYLRVSTKSTP